MKFPETIYIKKDGEGDETYLIAWDNADDCGDGKVAVYELKKVVKKRTETILEE